MMNDNDLSHDSQSSLESSDRAMNAEHSRNPNATGIGAIGGGITGAVLGRLINGKVGAAVGGIAGAVVGSIASNALVEFAEAVVEETSPTLGLGANAKPVELPSHYSWDELQALSKADV